MPPGLGAPCATRYAATCTSAWGLLPLRHDLFREVEDINATCLRRNGVGSVLPGADKVGALHNGSDIDCRLRPYFYNSQFPGLSEVARRVSMLRNECAVAGRMGVGFGTVACGNGPLRGGLAPRSTSPLSLPRL